MVQENRLRIAIPSKDGKGLDDEVSDVFGRSPSFTIVDVENGSVVEVNVIKNPAASFKHGAGPIVVKMLMEKRVDVAVSKEFGIGISVLLDQNKIKMIEVKGEISVRDAVEKALKILK